MTGTSGTGKRPGRPGVRPTMTTERVRKLLDYDPETGIFRRRSDGKRWKRGDFAGGINKTTGYLQIWLDGEMRLLHRLVYVWLDEDVPEYVDHIDRCRTNNRRSNLRAATASQNQFNRRMSCNNTTGRKGVHWNKGTRKFEAQITINNEQKYLGQFDTLDDASAARDAAAVLLHGEFAVLNNDLSSTAP